MKLLASLLAVLLAVATLPAVLAGGDASAPPCAYGGDSDPVLATIRTLESGGDYTAQATGSSASGAYQMIDTTWARYADLAGVDTIAYPRAYLAPPPAQDAAAHALVQGTLDTYHDVAAVPVAWYYPAALTNPVLLDTVPAPEAGNHLTVREYQDRWLATYREGAWTNGTCPGPDDGAPGDTSPQTPPSDSAAAVVAFARAQLGKPYQFGAQGPDSYDCSGLVTAAYRQVGIELPALSSTQARYGTPVNWEAEPVQPGDLVVTDGVDPPNGHIAIAIDANHEIQAPRTGDVVKITPIPFPLVTTIRRLLAS